MLRILVSDLFYFDLAYFFVTPLCYLVYDVSQPPMPRDGTLVGYIFSKRYKKVSPHRKSHNLLYNLLREKNKPPQEMVNKRGVPIGPTWLIRTLESTLLLVA